MDVREPFSIALMWFTGWHLVTMWQHPSPLSLAKPRQYLESYNRKAYVRPPTAWATAKKLANAERSVQPSFVWRCLKIMSHSCHFCFQQWAVGRRLNPSFDPYFGLTKCEDCCICQFLRHIVPTEGFSGLSKMGKLRRNTPNGNLNRKNDNTLWNFDELCGTDGYSIFSHPHIHAIQLKWSEPWCSHVSFMCSRSHVRVLAQPCRVLFIKSWEFP